MNFKLLIFCFIFIHCIEPLFQDSILIKILEINNKSNIMISPFSIYQALSILANGAVNETQKEILEVLFPYKNISDNNFTLTQLNTNFIKILNELSKEEVPLESQNKNDNEKNNNNLIFNNVNPLFIDSKLYADYLITIFCPFLMYIPGRRALVSST